MLTVYIRNISGLKPISDYDYIVLVNADKIASGTIKGHKRSDGWAKLVKRIVEENDK